MFSVGSEVILVGLTKDTALNGKAARVIGKYDGKRYAIKLTLTGCHIRVTPTNIVHHDHLEFLASVKHLTNELNYFLLQQHADARRIAAIASSETARSISTKRAVEPDICAIELQENKNVQLWLYDAQGVTAIVNAQPGTTTTNECGRVFRVDVPKCNVIINASHVIEDIAKCDVLKITCGTRTHLFRNEVSAFHMPLSHILDYADPYSMKAIEQNLKNIAHFTRLEPDVTTIQYVPEKRIILFRCESALRKIASPIWPKDAFVLASSLSNVMPLHRALSLQQASIDARKPMPDSPCVPLIIGLRVFHENVADQISGYDDQRQRVILASGACVPREALTPDMESCVAAEFVLAMLTVEYMHTKGISHETLAYAHRVIACTLDHIKKSTTLFATHCRDLSARNKVSEAIDQHSDDSTVLDNFMSKENCTAFLANLETFCMAIEMLLTTKPDEIFLCRDEGLIFIRNEMQTLHLASFDDTARIGQARILKTQFSRFQLSLKKAGQMSQPQAVEPRYEITQEDVERASKEQKAQEKAQEQQQLKEDVPRASKEQKAQEQQQLKEDVQRASKEQKAQEQQQLKEEKARNRLKAKMEKKKSRKLRKAAYAAACATVDTCGTGETEVTENEAKETAEQTETVVAYAKKAAMTTETVPASLQHESHKEYDEESSIRAAVQAIEEASETSFITVERSSRRECTRLRQQLHSANENLLKIQENMERCNCAKDTALKQRDEANRQRDEAFKQRDEANKQRDERDNAIKQSTKQRDAAAKQRDAAAEQRDSAARQRDTAIKQRDDALRELERKKGSQQKTTDAAKACKNLEHMLQRTSAIKETLLNMLAQQLRNYLNGPYMRLDAHSLSLAAVLRDGYAAKMIVNIYLMHDSQSAPRAVVEHAVMKQSDLTLRGDALSACSLHSKAS